MTICLRDEIACGPLFCQMFLRDIQAKRDQIRFLEAEYQATCDRPKLGS